MVEVIVFAVCAVIALAGAGGVIASKNPVHSALSLVATLFAIAVLFIAQEAHFLAAVQVIVYAGAIVVLFLFVIMLLGVDRTEDIEHDRLRGQRVAALVLGAIAAVGLGVLVATSAITGARSTGAAPAEDGQNVEDVGRLLFTDHLFAFEITSVLLIIAVVGAVVMARSRRGPQIDEDEPVLELGGAAEPEGAEAAEDRA